MNADQSLNPWSFFHWVSVGSFRYWVVISPFEASRPAGFRTAPTEDETLLRRWTGFQPMSAAFLIAWAANFGVVTLKNTLAPLFFRLTICESTVGSVTSYDCSSTIAFLAASASPSLNPFR